MHVRSWQVGYRGLLEDERLDGLRAADRAGKYTFDLVGPEHPVTTLAIENGKVCGFVTTGPSPDDAENENRQAADLHVDPGAWGRGVGRSLIANARSRLHRHGFSDAVLWVLSGNERRRSVLPRRWLVADGERRERVWSVRVDEICYRRQLP